MDCHSSSDPSAVGTNSGPAGSPRFCCPECSCSYKGMYNLIRHRKNHTSSNEHVCRICQGSFKRKDRLDRHRRIHERDSSYSRKGKPCARCSRRKVRCDRLMACSRCARGNYSCQYPGRDRALSDAATRLFPSRSTPLSPFATISAFPHPNATTASHIPPNHSKLLSPETITTLPSSGTATTWQSPEPQNAAMAPVVRSVANELPTMRDVRSFSMMETTLLVKTEAPSQVYNASYADCEMKLSGPYTDVQFSSAWTLLQENMGLQEIARLREENARLEEKIAQNRWLNDNLSCGTLNFMAQPLYSPKTSTWNFQDGGSATSNSSIAPQPCESYSGKCSVCRCPNFEMDTSRYCTTKFYKDPPPRMCKTCGHQDYDHAQPSTQVWADAGSILDISRAESENSLQLQLIRNWGLGGPV